MYVYMCVRIHICACWIGYILSSRGVFECNVCCGPWCWQASVRVGAAMAKVKGDLLLIYQALDPEAGTILPPSSSPSSRIHSHAHTHMHPHTACQQFLREKEAERFSLNLG